MMPTVNSMLLKVKISLLLSMLVFLINSCSQPNHKSEKAYAQPKTIAQNFKTTSELSPEQQSAFDALNRLQVSTDTPNRLYSTFAGIVQPCYPPDTSLTISQSELLIAMKQFVTSHCKNLTPVERDKLATAAVLAQKEYTLFLCLANSPNVDFEHGAPMTGTWVMPNVLDRRDIIMVW